MTRPASRLLKTAGARLALSYAALFGISALTLVLVLWFTTVRLLDGQVDAAIRADALGLAERWNEGGPQALLATINGRLVSHADEDALYLVIDPHGNSVIGNLAAWPAEVAEAGPIYELPVRRRGASSLARLHRFALPGGYALLVGRDVQSRAALRDLLTHTLAWALLLIGALSAAGALFVQRMVRRMVSQVSATAAAISAGDFSRRVRVSGRGDEFDQVAQTINDMLDRIGRLMEGVRDVSNAIAHDLRTPITRARARLEDAASHGDSPAELQAAIQRAISDLDGITAVFQALLRISEIEAGARRSAFTTFDLAPVLGGLAELYGAVADEHGLMLAIDVVGPIVVRADRDLIQQAVANLLDNAIKFSTPGTTVRLAAGAPGPVMLTVSDQGPGIASQDIARAAERFFRGEVARHTPGFGLGLTLVQAVAQLHGGTLTLVPLNPGLQAALTLPITMPGPFVAGGRPSLAGQALPPPRQHEDITISRLTGV